MSWEWRGPYLYYYHKYRDASGRLCCIYLGRSLVAEAASQLHTHQRLGRVKLQHAARKTAESICQPVEAVRSRINNVVQLVNRSMTVAGYYKHRGSWRRRGLITMRTLDKDSDSIQRAIDRDRARRYFDLLDGPVLEAALSRCGEEMWAVALEKLLGRITSDAFQREAYIRKIKRFEKKLAGDEPSHLVRMLARSVAILRVERGLADAKFFDLIGIGLGGRVDEFVLKWREFADRRLNAAIKTLAYVRKIEASTIERTVARFRIAG
jgi:hypothetical protein